MYFLLKIVDIVFHSIRVFVHLGWFEKGMTHFWSNYSNYFLRNKYTIFESETLNIFICNVHKNWHLVVLLIMSLCGSYFIRQSLILRQTVRFFSSRKPVCDWISSFISIVVDSLLYLRLQSVKQFCFESDIVEGLFVLNNLDKSWYNFCTPYRLKNSHFIGPIVTIQN